jgi:hypothetical protein
MSRLLAPWCSVMSRSVSRSPRACSRWAANDSEAARKSRAAVSRPGRVNGSLSSRGFRPRGPDPHAAEVG